MILNLEVIPANRQDRRDQATHYFEAGDAVCFVGSANGYGKLTLVFDNIHQLRERGIYEEALLTAYTGVKGNLRRWSLDILKFMFEQADQARLRGAGNPLPHEGPFTLYRGVSGKGRARRVRGLSWTASREHAWWHVGGCSLILRSSVSLWDLNTSWRMSAIVKKSSWCCSHLQCGRLGSVPSAQSL